jgi:hypothetical protein
MGVQKHNEHFFLQTVRVQKFLQRNPKTNLGNCFIAFLGVSRRGYFGETSKKTLGGGYLALSFFWPLTDRPTYLPRA